MTYPSRGGSCRLSRTEGNNCCEETAWLEADIEVKACLRGEKEKGLVAAN